MKRVLAVMVGILMIGFLLLPGCGGGESDGGDAKPVARTTNGNGLGGDAAQVAKDRDLTPDDVVAALKTYMPTGRHDPYIMFASGGHSGQVFVIGVPSMRLLRVIGVFTPEPWQGWGYGIGNEILADGAIDGHELTWGDTHHPALSETGGDYDGQFCFINDKANARVAVIDLRDFETKQIVNNPIALNDHGGTMVTPDSEWIIEGGQYGSPLAGEYAPIDEYNESFKGMVTLWKFDRKKGRIDPSKSFAMELPPYWQDLFDAGKKVSEGWIFGNSFNTELATGAKEIGDTSFFEAGVSQRDNDYLHIINLKKAVQVYEAGKVEKIKGMPVISLDTALAEELLYFAPEPKSPHGVDVTPGGEYLVVSGKLDPHVTIYSFDKIQEAIAAKNWTKEQYGVPVLDFDAVVEAQVEVGLGPLHTQFDDKGYAYTSLFLVPAVARWTLGGNYSDLHDEADWELIQQANCHYNIGHLVAAEGDTVSPDGKFLVALNKWSIDRFFPTGPLLPQNFQLMDIDNTGDDIKLLYDMPIGIGEPHYAQIIKADKLDPWKVYPEIGWDPVAQRVDINAPQPGRERIERNGSTVEIYMTAVRSHFVPEHVTVREGDHVIWHITNVETAQDATHGFALPVFNVNLSLEPGETGTFEFTADKAGTYSYYCSEFCSALHLEMTGYFFVEPKQQASR
ncbi:MAG: Sec-dependent nitrous-oxide reductase [Planctomycetes bacterium]|nr:Sec-dependent nitrous-oxide reductase [Planctomycetota bacterium]